MLKKITIDLELYSKELIMEWINDFLEVTDIVLIWDELHIEWDDEASIDEVFNEFMNYLLSL